MCTVTYIPTPKGALLTSNRDENSSRGPALPPQLNQIADSGLLFPQDTDAGGSWIVLKNNTHAAVLLNGAFTRHKPRPPYRKSRGLVLLDIMRSSQPLPEFATIGLQDIEPFTLILLAQDQLWEGRWDGSEKHLRLLDPAKPRIWSSVTLYSEKEALQRRRWFEEWLPACPQVDMDKVIGFHRAAGRDDPRNALVMNRDNRKLTVSITAIQLTPGASRMVHHDLRANAGSVTVSPLKEKINTVFGNISTRIAHWEYWPGILIYGPLFPWWLWLSWKARSFFWFSAANPGIENAGFTQERKSAIYKRIPGQYHPRTLLVKAGSAAPGLTSRLQKVHLEFPLIAKPDTGERGTQVKRLDSPAHLEQYTHRSKVDFLVQEYISYENEAGIFYARLPGEKTGRITGIVGKEFLTVTGNGHSTLRDLIRRSPRASLQIHLLQREYARQWLTIPSAGTTVRLVPYGNHSRGAKFLDWSHRISPRLTATMDGICQQIPGFDFGRLDIRFADWSALEAGKDFSIIELNGAGSEPTHIYDPAHSLLFAWKEIIRHWRLLYDISSLNAGTIPLMTTRQGLAMIRAHWRHNRSLQQL